ncbi:MAG: hypothetical protein COV02_00220 [Candidatus Terrybacteria bacterium CG10_big_fil_rev_8_21_14_0_10_41_10]|uniref:Uncharacterized protein n=1 Tax=Candidatus Terrybacteria bacterium CG10_big_fil_rev_8_21_14_0_10_41_10 TaxID=1975026 RepID=A0A2M8LBI8_9BACT|nr:MAG: hypothetical protein COV02_00220 [Candidatus Terrybacteria bacterium CG10_big_fil_rev_8_21_14_0_10_41_10]
MIEKNSNKITEGVLKKDEIGSFIEGLEGKRHFSGERIWEGYTSHWLEKKVFARELKQLDYKTDMPIVLVWSGDAEELKNPVSNYIEVYYNERLIKYWSSFLGHVAANINGDIFNFSNKINENEILSPEEYFYRPALGEFSPGLSGGQDFSNPKLPHYDKFGRRFMRSIHVVRIEGEGLDAAFLKDVFNKKLNKIYNTPVDPARPDFYRDFNFRKNSCATIIRDGLREGGFADASGFCPRDFFVSCAKSFRRIARERNLSVSLRLMSQLKVPEAPPSRMTPLLNPINHYRKRKYLDNVQVQIIP